MDVLNDTIAAVSTAMTPSGIGIVRLSGADALKIADKLYVSKAALPALEAGNSEQFEKVKKRLSAEKANTIHYGYIRNEQDEIVDEVLVMLMRAPHSYTGEDTVEIDCHGGILAMRQILDACIRAGARPAEPGEYTKRAFLNGRIDLTQAEAVMDLIQAKNTYALKNSLHQLKGNLQKKIRRIRERLLYEIAFIESALDDPEHISLEGYPERLMPIVEEELRHLDKLLSTADEGKLLHEGIKTVIVGKPNAGKSSLLNYLIGEEKAIVTDIEGTTRDVVEETLNLQGITLRILDTAGIRKSDSKVEQIGIEKAKEHAKDADLILCMVDGTRELDERDLEIFDLIRDKKAIVLLNKADQKLIVSQEALSSLLSAPVLTVSAREGDGIPELEQMMKDLFFRGEIQLNDEVYLTNARHKKALEDAKRSLEFVRSSSRDGMPEDFYSIDLMGAYESLGYILGEALGEDLVNEIFSKFCTGK